jgi:hypothetical protein
MTKLNRRGFLQALGIGAGAAIAGVAVGKEIVETPNHALEASNDLDLNNFQVRCEPCNSDWIDWDKLDEMDGTINTRPSAKVRADRLGRLSDEGIMSIKEAEKELLATWMGTAT